MLFAFWNLAAEKITEEQLALWFECNAVPR
jgi:hypothetical protein